MIRQFAGRAALAALGMALALGAAACSDPEAEARAQAEAAAKVAKAKAEDKLKRRLAHDVECLSALRWQAAALPTAGIGKPDLYTEYFRSDLKANLGSNLFTSEPPKPSLSRATLDDYLEWSYANLVETKFAIGKDSDGDGKIADGERRYDLGFAAVAGCVQQVAESGRGPLAKMDKVARMYRIKYVRERLKEKGA